MTKHTLAFETLAEIGDKIRAYDFIHNKTAYIEGAVIDKGWVKQDGVNLFKGYTVKVDLDSLEGGKMPKREIVYVPFEMSFLEFDNRIEKI